jgi:hypothetical protein
LIGKCEGRRELGRPSHRWEDNIKMDLGNMETEGINLILLGQDMALWWASVNML